MTNNTALAYDGLAADSLITNIRNLAQEGMGDNQIGRRLGKHYKTIQYHRQRHDIAPGRSYRGELSRERRALNMNKRTYKLVAGVQGESPNQRIKHGLNALVPLMCQGTKCPYRATCTVSDDDLALREPCVVESGLYAYLFEGYLQEFQAYADNIADLTRIRHLADIEIKIMRCNRLTAANPEMVITTRVVSKQDGVERVTRKLNPIVRYELLLLDERMKIIKDLRAMVV